MLFDSSGSIALTKTKSVVDIQLQFYKLLERYLLINTDGDHEMTAQKLGNFNDVMSHLNEI